MRVLMLLWNCCLFVCFSIRLLEWYEAQQQVEKKPVESAPNRMGAVYIHEYTGEGGFQIYHDL